MNFMFYKFQIFRDIQTMCNLDIYLGNGIRNARYPCKVHNNYNNTHEVIFCYVNFYRNFVDRTIMEVLII